MADRDERLEDTEQSTARPVPGPGTTPGALPPDDEDVPTGAMSSGELRSPDNNVQAPVDE